MADVKESSSACLEAAKFYDERGYQLREQVLDDIAEFDNPNKARAIREARDDLEREIRSFFSTSASLASSLAILYLAYDQELLSYQSNILGELVTWASQLPTAYSPGGDDEHRDAYRAAMSGLTEAQQRLAFIGAQAIITGREMDWAFRITTNVLVIRSETLDRFHADITTTEKVPATGIRGLIGFTEKAAETEATLFAAEQIVAAAALVLGVAAPIAVPVIAIIKLGMEVRDGQRELVERQREWEQKLQSRFERNVDDELFDVLDLLRDGHGVAKNVVTLLGNLTTDLLAPSP